MATLRWSGQIANTSETGSSVTIDGRLYSTHTRVNNTIQITEIRVGHSMATSGGFWDWEWQADAQINSTYEFTNRQTKGRTGTTVITGNWYYTSDGAMNISVGTGSGTYALRGNWESSGTGDASALQSVNVSYPAAGSPTIDTKSVDLIERRSARVNWTSSNGTYCTFSDMKLEWGETVSYGTQQTGLAADSNYTITNLKPGTVYYYKLTITNGAGLTGTSTGSFETLPLSGGFIQLMLD